MVAKVEFHFGELFPRAVGDINADGLLNLAVANVGSNDVSVLINNAPSGKGKSKT